METGPRAHVKCQTRVVAEACKGPPPCLFFGSASRRSWQLRKTPTMDRKRYYMKRILQEITAAGRWLEGMDSTIPVMAAETKSIHLGIADFQSRVSGLEQGVTAVDDHLNTVPEQDQELLFLHSKLIDLEDNAIGTMSVSLASWNI
ncbi:hypothetical protein NDU88_004472 [Pleurodeles waltl]|uniref:Uncharacterized protein n=1 Tax=Pleurodeles waltl TaxID=8319 RepID=A0AAV7UFB5_PLEWA|nr:hypothetical protein NDU88_004472 [Pleurodeles waltl]